MFKNCDSLYIVGSQLSFHFSNKQQINDPIGVRGDDRDLHKKLNVSNIYSTVRALSDFLTINLTKNTRLVSLVFEAVNESVFQALTLRKGNFSYE